MVIDKAQIQTRHAIVPIDEIVQRRSVSHKSREYQKHAVALGREVAIGCLSRAGMTPTDIDMIITVHVRAL